MLLSCCPGGSQSVFKRVGEEDDDEDDDEDEPDAVYPDAFLADELDPDDDVGLYVEDDDGFLLEDGLADLEDTESEDLEEWEEAEWEEGWGPGAANDYHRNLIRFRVMHVSFVLR